MQEGHYQYIQPWQICQVSGTTQELCHVLSLKNRLLVLPAHTVSTSKIVTNLQCKQTTLKHMLLRTFFGC